MFRSRQRCIPTLYFPSISLGSRQVAASAERQARERELAKVHVTKEDIDLIAEEMEISRARAERTLREHGGDVVEALATLTN